MADAGDSKSLVRKGRASSTLAEATFCGVSSVFEVGIYFQAKFAITDTQRNKSSEAFIAYQHENLLNEMLSHF